MNKVVGALLSLALASCQIYDIGCDVADGTCDPLLAAFYYNWTPPCMATTNMAYAVEPLGELSRIAGQTGMVGTANGEGLAASFSSPRGLITDCESLYVVEQSNHAIRKVDLETYVVSTLAGQPGVPGSADGTGTAAAFNFPRGGTIAGLHLYIADSTNHTIRQVHRETGETLTIAGQAGSAGSTDGVALDARFSSPSSAALVGAYIFITDTVNQTIRRLDLRTLEVITFAGQTGVPGTLDGFGTGAQFSGLLGLASDGRYLYAPDSGNHIIRRVDTFTAEVSTVAGQSTIAGAADGVGSAATFDSPRGVATDGVSLFINDRNNHLLRKMNLTTFEVTTLVGTAGVTGAGDGAPGQLNGPEGDPAVDRNFVYIADTGNHTLRLVR
jgi:hypothetical protein